MLHLLKNHPFAVEAFFDRSTVLTFAIPKEKVTSLIPECLAPDIFEDKWAFVAAAMVQTRQLRPKGFPRWMGNDFFLVGYRIFVRYTNRAGKRLRGLYILRSETNKKKMEMAGNLFTHYNYTTTDIKHTEEGGLIKISSQKSGFYITLQRSSNEEISLPPNSPFPSWKEARRFAGPLPFTFTYNKPAKEVLIIEGVRQHWQPAPVQVLDHHFGFLQTLNLGQPVLANAFIIENIPYYWKKGKIEQWQP